MTLGRNTPPRDAVAATHLWVPVDATGDDFYALGGRFGTQVGVLHKRHEQSEQPYAAAEGTGFFDPRALRWHDLQRETERGVSDRRMAIQVVNDFDAPYEDARPGDAPFGQPELFTALNRTTREADTRGRVALPSSHRRIIDSEDDRFALALTCRSVPLAAASASHPDQQVDVVESLPDGMIVRQAGTTTGTHGSVTQTQPSVSIGGVTFFGQAAVDAAKDAIAQGGSVSDAARWASAAARNLPRPPLLDAEAGDGDVGSTRTRDSVPPPDTNEEGMVPLLDHPAGYVWSLAGRVGLLGTLVCPEGAHGHYFTGREGTRIGPLPLRHDAQITMGEACVGRMVFVQDDAAQIPEGSGKLIKGELWADSSRANQDTALGHETVQFRPVVRVDADLPPSKPPPDPPPWTWVDPGREKDEDDDDDEEGGGPPGRGGGPGGGGPPGGNNPGESSGEEPDTTIGVIHSPSPRRVEPSDPNELGPVAHAGSQSRDYSGPGEPCPNATAGTFVPSSGVFIATGTPPVRIGGLPIQRVPGGYIQYSGHPGLTRISDGLVVGGEEAPLPLGLPAPTRGGIVVEPGPDRGVPRGRRVPGDDPGQLPLGLPGGNRGGIEVDPAPDDGVPRGQPVPGDDPGRIPLGLPGGGGGGLGFEPPPGGDRGVPRGWAERQERREREDRARRAREARDKAERDEIDRLRDLEERARENGQARKGDRIKRARERIERQRQRREDRQRRRDEYEKKKQREREERRRRREERQRKREEERAATRARRNRARDDERERRKREGFVGSPPQGGYMIDVTDEASEVLTTGRLPDEERRRLEEDEKRRRAAQESRFGDWNVANRPLPFFGAAGGPRSLEDWAHLTTYAVRAAQRVLVGAFAGPSYLAANVGVVHRNTPENPPAGSRIGAHWTVPHDEQDLQVCDGEAVVEVTSTLEAGPGQKICACTGAVLRVARAHVGDGQIDDLRPLLLLDNGDRPGVPVRADLASDLGRRVYIDHERGLTAARLRTHTVVGERGPLLEVARIDPDTRAVRDQLLDVNEEGVLRAHAGAHVGRRLALAPGAPLELEDERGQPVARLAVSERGLELALRSEDGVRRMTLTPEGLLVEGDLILKGKLVQSGA